MNTEQDPRGLTVKYEKPTVADLGAAAAVLGASCVPGDEVGQGFCSDLGNSAGGDCMSGSHADFYCGATGNAASGECLEVGSSAITSCQDGSVHME